MNSSSVVSMSHKGKILMLHGWLQNAKIFHDKSLGFMKQLRSTPLQEFDFIDAPLTPSEDDLKHSLATAIVKKKENDVQYRTWIYSRADRTVYAFWKHSTLHILKHMKGKNFDALLGFSQGGVMVSMVGALVTLYHHGLLNREHLPATFFEEQEHDEDETTFDEIIDMVRQVFFTKRMNDNGVEEQVCSLKFLILVGTFKPLSIQSSELVQVLTSRGLKIGSGLFTSCHIFGLEDNIIPPERSRELADDWYPKDSLLLTHPKKHILPTGEGFDKEELRRFIRSSL